MLYHLILYFITLIFDIKNYFAPNTLTSYTCRPFLLVFNNSYQIITMRNIENIKCVENSNEFRCWMMNEFTLINIVNKEGGAQIIYAWGANILNTTNCPVKCLIIFRIIRNYQQKIMRRTMINYAFSVVDIIKWS